MDNDEADQRLTKRRRLDETEATNTLAARQLGTSGPSQVRSGYGDVNIAGQSRAHLGDVIVNCSNDRKKTRDEVLLDSLTFNGMDARLNNVTRATPTTCDWLFRHKKLKAWLQDSQVGEHHGFLWIKGKPGSGKSTIMKTVWSWAKTEQSNNTILSYFFNARAPGDLEKSSLGLYRSLVHQVLHKIPNSKPIFFAKFLSKERDGKVEEWNKAELQEFLIDVVKIIDGPPLSMFIDALDEGDEDDVRMMIDFLQELGRHSKSSVMRPRICLSSRHYPQISIRKSLSLTVEHQPEHQQDIKTYVQQNFSGLDSPQMKGLQEKVCLKADGIFLWVIFVVRMLKKVYDRGEGISVMLKLLEKTPQRLGRALCRHFETELRRPRKLHIAFTMGALLNTSIKSSRAVPSGSVQPGIYSWSGHHSP